MSGDPAKLLSFPAVASILETVMYYFGMFMAGLGAAAIIGALTFVTLVIGGLVNGMVVLIAGPLIDGYLAKRGARRETRPAGA